MLGYTKIVEAERSNVMSDPDTDAVGADAPKSPDTREDPGRETADGQPQPVVDDAEELEPTIVLGRE